MKLTRRHVYMGDLIGLNLPEFISNSKGKSSLRIVQSGLKQSFPGPWETSYVLFNANLIDIINGRIEEISIPKTL